MNLFLALAVWSLKASLLLAIGFLGLLVFRNRSGAVRNLICRGLLVAVVSIPVWMATGEFLGSRSHSPVLVAPTRWRIADPAAASRRPVTREDVIAPPYGTPLSKPFPWLTVLSAVYASGLTATLLLFTLQVVAARRVVTGATPYPGDRHGLPRWLPIVMTNRISVPATLGWRRPLVLMTVQALEWKEAAREAALAHEWAHICRADWFWQTGAILVACIHWFNPLVWALRDMLRQTAEVAADDLAIREGLDPATYARQLLEIASRRIVAPSGAVAMARKLGFKSRIHGLMDRRRDRTVPGRGWRVGTTLALAAPALAVGGAFEHGLAPSQTSARYDDQPSNLGPFRLPNGDEIRLDYVEDWDPYPNRLWKPAGGPVSSVERQQSIHVGPGPRAESPDSYYRFFKFTKTGGRSFDWVIRVPFTTHQAAYMTYGDKDGRMVDMAAVRMEHAFNEIDLKVGVPYGPWQQYAQEGLGGERLNAQIIDVKWEGWWDQHCGNPGPVVGETEPPVGPLPTWPDNPKPSTTALAGTSIVPSSTETVVEGDREVQIEYTVPEEFRDCQLYLKAFEGKRELGIQRLQIECSGVGGFPNNRRSVVFYGNSAKITRVELVGRPYGWATFRGVRTEPN